jgi:hypothetical protein
MRAISGQFKIGRNALARHQEHIVKGVQRAIQKRQEREDTAVAETWETRLESTYAAARRGIDRAEKDPDKWTHAAGFVSVAAKICDTGLRTIGSISDGRGGTTINVAQMLVMPRAGIQAPAEPVHRARIEDAVIDVVPDAGDER